MVVPICFVVIFALLYSTLRSVRHGTMVFTGVPLAQSGGILTPWLRSMPFSISAAVALIALSDVGVLPDLYRRFTPERPASEAARETLAGEPA